MVDGGNQVLTRIAVRSGDKTVWDVLAPCFQLDMWASRPRVLSSWDMMGSKMSHGPIFLLVQTP